MRAFALAIIRFHQRVSSLWRDDARHEKTREAAMAALVK